MTKKYMHKALNHKIIVPNIIHTKYLNIGAPKHEESSKCTNSKWQLLNLDKTDVKTSQALYKSEIVTQPMKAVSFS